MKNLTKNLVVPAALALLAGACSNPAADAPAAEVAEAPAEAPAEEAAPAATTWVFQEGSTIGFVGSKVTGSHDGGFESFDGTVTATGDTPETATVDVTIDMSSTWSDSEKLTGHLKSDDFFGVETHPTSTFTTTSIAPATPAEGETEAEGYTVTGNLNLHGVEKQITFPAMIEMTADGMTAKAEFSIKRFDFGIEYAGPADNLINDDVLIKLDLVAGPAMEAEAEAEVAEGEDAEAEPAAAD